MATRVSDVFFGAKHFLGGELFFVVGVLVLVG